MTALGMLICCLLSPVNARSVRDAGQQVPTWELQPFALKSKAASQPEQNYSTLRIVASTGVMGQARSLHPALNSQVPSSLNIAAIKEMENLFKSSLLGNYWSPLNS